MSKGYDFRVGDTIKEKGGDGDTWKVIAVRAVLEVSGPGPCRSVAHVFPQDAELVSRDASRHETRNTALGDTQRTGKDSGSAE